MSNRQLTVGSLFAGIGGLDLGLERAGMKVLWQVENNEFCQRVLAKHWPDVPCYGDVRECGGHNLAPVDLICGGFPCQPVSVAGKQKGDSDERWLWPEFARLIRELRPRWVLAENVPGLLSANAGREFGTVLRDLAALGYDAEWECIPAAAVGAPHIRDRVFILAHAAQSVLSEIDPENTGLCNEWRQWKPGRANGMYPGGRGWAPEPSVDRVVDGLSPVMDHLRALGNAVVPGAAEWIGRLIVEADKLPSRRH